MKKIPNDLWSRVPYFKRLHPLGEEQFMFRKDLKTTIEQYYSKHFPGYLRIKLTWGELPQDLDLYLRITDMSNKQYWVNYNNKGSYLDAPFAVLDEDCRKGPGAESIGVNRWTNDAVYDVFVSNYYRETDISDEIQVSIAINGTTLFTKRKKAIQKGSFWHVYCIKEDDVELVDQIEENLSIDD